MHDDHLLVEFHGLFFCPRQAADLELGELALFELLLVGSVAHLSLACQKLIVCLLGRGRVRVRFFFPIFILFINVKTRKRFDSIF